MATPAPPPANPTGYCALPQSLRAAKRRPGCSPGGWHSRSHDQAWRLAPQNRDRAVDQPHANPPGRYCGRTAGSTEHYGCMESGWPARVHWRLPLKSFIVGIVARVSIVKRHLLLVDVFARLLKRFPEALLLIVGDGVRLPAVRARIRELGIGESVLVMGERHDVPTLLAAMDVFCLPSEMEGMPMTVLEAMAAALPVVTSRSEERR